MPAEPAPPAVAPSTTPAEETKANPGPSDDGDLLDAKASIFVLKCSNEAPVKLIKFNFWASQTWSIFVRLVQLKKTFYCCLQGPFGNTSGTTWDRRTSATTWAIQPRARTWRRTWRRTRRKTCRSGTSTFQGKGGGWRRGKQGWSQRQQHRDPKGWGNPTADQKGKDQKEQAGQRGWGKDWEGQGHQEACSSQEQERPTQLSQRSSVESTCKESQSQACGQGEGRLQWAEGGGGWQGQGQDCPQDLGWPLAPYWSSSSPAHAGDQGGLRPLCGEEGHITFDLAEPMVYGVHQGIQMQKHGPWDSHARAIHRCSRAWGGRLLQAWECSYLGFSE